MWSKVAARTVHVFLLPDNCQDWSFNLTVSPHGPHAWPKTARRVKAYDSEMAVQA